MTTAAAQRRRVHARVEGTVQGVGFRPYVYRLAHELGLGGTVLNDERGVVLEVEGEPRDVERFLERLPAEAPPLASIQSVRRTELAATGQREFAIAESESADEPAAPVSPDAATCADCLAELFDPADRRYRYPFVNCTNCGPRFTIVRGVPYDRPLTTMAGFGMCAACSAEYHDPADRRFHAEPNACPDCGPELTLGRSRGQMALEAAVSALSYGRIVAIKGLGGFHLACRADDESAVARLRSRKRREDRPFALMAPDPETAHTLVDLGPDEEALLTGRERPIVVARRRPGAQVAASVAPRSADLGVMLPYSPLHHLLAADTGTTLVMTSGNSSDEPIAYGDADALERLADIADAFLLHDRPIQTRTDDSVVRASSSGPLHIRRSRGFVPAPLALPVETPRPLLACGAELKSTFCVAKEGRAWVGHHIGDLKNWETLRSFREGVEHFERLFAARPEVVAHDLHPDYLSTAFALEREGAERTAVQHHHAHLAACLAEHGETGPAIGAIYDGAGLGEDGTVWGGEILAGGLGGFQRAAHLWPVRLPGGDQAVREPWRMACAWLLEAVGDDAPLPASLEGDVDPERWATVGRLARGGIASPLTTSAGRLFDAVAALCGVRARVTYEGQAAAELEGLAHPAETGAYPLPVSVHGRGPAVLDARETVRAVSWEVERGLPVPVVAARFHNALAGATARACAYAAELHGAGSVVLSGGVFQNRLLLERTAGRLAAAGLRLLVPRLLPPNDGGISYGQAAVAAWRLAAA